MSLKKQHILVIIQDIHYSEVAIRHAFSLAKFFKSEVAFGYYPSKKNQDLLPAKNFIEKNNLYAIPYQLMILKNHKSEPNHCIQELDAIFIVTQFRRESLSYFPKNHSIFKWIFDAKIPSIIVTEHTKVDYDYKNIIVPINYKKESKEKMIWASYFGRFNNALIHIIAPNEKYEAYLRTIKATLLFTKKMFEQFSFEYKTVKASCQSKNINREAITYSKSLDSALIVLISNRDPGWIASYCGPSELKCILKKEENPILFINPLKDYYLPCD
ncbi:hypothetical protein [Labilibaculum filiforme]|nr:hypothetical protein [Labilibaculum filiforme]